MPRSKLVPPQPLQFGFDAAGTPALMGWLHSAPLAIAPRVGAVICPPFGYEAVCARRSLTALAAAFAGVGVPTLRFDYHGTGDSAGDDLDPDRVAAWQASIDAAIAEVRAIPGITAVVLVGLRLGALLASTVAATRQDIAALVAIAPVLQGRAYLRELRVLQMALGLAQPPTDLAWTPPAREAVGFALSEATVNELGALSMPMQQAVAPHLLIVDRSDMSIGDAWPSAQRSQAVDVVVHGFAGYATMMLDPHKVQVPTTMIDGVVGWLAQVTADVAASSAVAAARAPSPLLVAGTVRTTPILLPGPTKLFGIKTEWLPSGVAGRRGRGAGHAVLMLNAGAVHHIGPNRLYVALARRLAAQGVASVSLDIAGIGDSRAATADRENIVYPPSAVEDVQRAIAVLQQEYQEVSVLGLCAGGYHGFKAAVAGAAVQRAVIINPLTYFWSDGMSLDAPEATVVGQAKEYQASMLSLEKWRKVLRGEVNLPHVARIVARRLQLRAQHAGRDVVRRVGVRWGDDLGYEITAAGKRGVALHFVFAKGEPGLAMLHEQGGRVVRQALHAGAVTVDVIDGADHTFTACWTHELLLTTLLQRLLSLSNTIPNKI